MCDLVSFIQMFQYVSPQLFWQGTICLFIYLYSFSYNNVSVNLKPNVMVCAFLFRLKWNEMFLIEMMIIFNRNELLNTVDRHCAWLDHFCKRLFAGHVVGFRPMEKKKNLHRMTIWNIPIWLLVNIFLAKLALKWTPLSKGCLKNFMVGEIVGVEVRN